MLAKQQNYKSLVDDLITEESRSWAINRYQAGSVQVTAVQHNGDGTPKEIDAKYIVTTMGSQAPGKVRVTFAEDEPPCLYFSDAPTNCRIPIRSWWQPSGETSTPMRTAPVYPEIEPWDDPPGAVDARRRAFEKVQADVAAANARRAAAGGSVRPRNPGNPPVPLVRSGKSLPRHRARHSGSQFAPPTRSARRMSGRELNSLPASTGQQDSRMGKCLPER